MQTSVPAPQDPAARALVDRAGLRRVVSLQLAVALVSLAIGGIFGLFQALNTAGVSLYGAVNRALPLAVAINYYEGLTVHGVMMALVFTTFFICGFLVFVAAQSLAEPLFSPRLEWVAWWLMLVGLVLAALAILTNNATVLYTFYPPMKASPPFYIGLTLVVVGSWLVAADIAAAFARWRRGHPGERSPLPAFMALITMLMWVIASLGIAAEMLFQLIPWSFGWLGGVDPLLNRTLFWLTGHAIVYFWLLPAYISWYTIVPRQAGGRVFSDAMARFPFLLFLAYSIPVGVHHQFEDPGIGEGVKFVQAFFTFIVFFPSLLTAFALAASFESVSWAKGRRVWLGWIRDIPWGDPSLAAQVLAMLLFIFGGAGGLINASYSLDLLVHNTAWIVGHFHLTVGSAVALTFMGVAYWLVPHLAGRPLWSRRLALAQVWTWTAGMVLFSATLHYLGTIGMPRRTDMATVSFVDPSWHAWFPVVGAGGVVLFASGAMFFANVALTLWRSPRAAQAPIPFAEFIHGPASTPAFFDRLAPWLVITVALIVIAYGPVVVQFVSQPAPVIQGFRVW